MLQTPDACASANANYFTAFMSTFMLHVPLNRQMLPDVGMVTTYSKCLDAGECLSKVKCNVMYPMHLEANGDLWGLYAGCNVKEAPSLFL